MIERKGMIHRGREAARQFQETIVPHMLGPWIPDLIGMAGLGPGDHVLDLACGTGAVSRAIAERVLPSGSLYAVDINAAMLEVAREAAREPGTRIHWVLGDAVELPISAASVDVVVCQQGLQFFPDRAGALREMKRVLLPQGRVALAVWSNIENNPYCLSLARSLAGRVGDEVSEQMRSSFSLCDTRELRDLFEGAGFAEVEIRPVSKVLTLPPLPEFIPRHLGGTSVADTIASAGTEARAGIVSDVMHDLRHHEMRGEPALPFEVNIAVAR
jgi:ubiquinone/menaquinone biosynthesis C-methylase UbiE